MANIKPIVSTAVWLCMSLGIYQESFTKDIGLKPEEVVAAHLKSIGSPKILETIKSRLIRGTASLMIIRGGFGNVSEGQSVIASDGRKLGIAMKFPALDYPGEHFAFNGDDVTVGYIDFDRKSIFADFIRQFYGLMKEGLLGGASSVAWPLLDVQERRPKLKYNKREIEGRQLHELTYSPKSRSGMEGLRIRLFFDLETFRHVMTEYRYRQDLSFGGTNVTVLKEQFDDFREVDGMMLPHKYMMEFFSTGPGFHARWTIEAKQWRHNSQIDPELFKAKLLRTND